MAIDKASCLAHLLARASSFVPLPHHVLTRVHVVGRCPALWSVTRSKHDGVSLRHSFSARRSSWRDADAASTSESGNSCAPLSEGLRTQKHPGLSAHRGDLTFRLAFRRSKLIAVCSSNVRVSHDSTLPHNGVGTASTPGFPFLAIHSEASHGKHTCSHSAPVQRRYLYGAQA